MPFNIDDIKKLPAKEKLKSIDDIWESIEEGWKKDDSGKEPPEVIALVEERLEQYKKGETKSHSWDEVEGMVKKNLEQQRNEKK